MQPEFEIPDGKSVIIIHPQVADAHRYLAPFLDHTPIVYVKMRGTALSTEALTQQVKAACDDHADNLAWSQVTTVVLDEADRATEAAVVRVVEWLLNEGIGRVVIAARDLHIALLQHDGLRSQVHLLPVDAERMLTDYRTELGASDTLLEVRALGRGEVYRNGCRIESWDGDLPRHLFFYLVDHRISKRGDIFDVFWPTLSRSAATNVFHVTKRKINEVLGVDLTKYSGGFYKLSPEIDIRYDVTLFEEGSQSLGGITDDEGYHAMQRRLILYRGQFLTDTENDNWVSKRRAELHRTRGELYYEMALYQESQDNLELALGLYLQAYYHDAKREDIAASIMTLYNELGEHCRAVHIFKHLKTVLKTKLNLPPNDTLQALYEKTAAACDEM